MALISCGAVYLNILVNMFLVESRTFLWHSAAVSLALSGVARPSPHYPLIFTHFGILMRSVSLRFLSDKTTNLQTSLVGYLFPLP